MLRQTFTAALATLAALGSFTLATAQEPKAASNEKQITNSIGMKLTLIPSGEFKMGSGESAEETAAFFKRTYGGGLMHAGDFKAEHPRHRVRITKPFYLGTY
jgi:formylglycine-generating enzyme required for sulfatase activity